jgi:autotransporter-associated beta strand protein
MLTGNRTLTNTSYSVTVGAGGAAPNYNAGSTTRGSNGGNSTFGDISALGGGGGGGGENSFSGVGADGGSGGGGGSKYSNAGGNSTSGQGFNGGNARNGDGSSAGDRTAGGGGGGAGGAGSTPASGSSTAGNGGVGRASDITGTSVTYAGGGGGGARDLYSGQARGLGGSGGGGNGTTTGNATSGIDGLGGGGGGAGADGMGGDGGDGIVIVRYKGSSLGSIGGNVTSGTGAAAGYTLHTFTTTGNSSLNLSAVNMNTRLGTTLNGTISGNGRLTFNGPGTLNLTGNNTYTGGTTVNGGRLIGNVNSVRGDITNNSELEFNQASYGNSFASISGNGSLTKTGAGDLILSGANTYSGGTTISAGRLIGYFGSLQGNITNNSQLQYTTTGSDVSYNSNISGNGSFTKNGEGKLILSGSNTYTGATSIDEGSLAVNGSLGNTSVTVGNGSSGYFEFDGFGQITGWVPTFATLQGSGSIGGAVTITSQGILSAGNSIESLAMGSLTLQDGSSFIQEVDSSATVGTQADLVVVNGNLNLFNGAVSLTLTDLAGSWNWLDGTKLTMINYSGTWNGGLFAMNGDALEDDSFINIANGKGWIINYNDTTGGSNYSSEQTLSKFVTLTAIPEPTVVTLGGLGALLLLRRRRA